MAKFDGLDPLEAFVSQVDEFAAGVELRNQLRAAVFEDPRPKACDCTGVLSSGFHPLQTDVNR